MKLTTRLTEIENNEVDVQMKLQNLESADVFLQEAHRLPFSLVKYWPSLSQFLGC